MLFCYRDKICFLIECSDFNLLIRSLLNQSANMSLFYNWHNFSVSLSMSCYLICFSLQYLYVAWLLGHGYLRTEKKIKVHHKQPFRIPKWEYDRNEVSKNKSTDSDRSTSEILTNGWVSGEKWYYKYVIFSYSALPPHPDS